MTLTRAQRRELAAQRTEPQHTFGRRRARTQRVLVHRGLSQYLDAAGKPMRGPHAHAFADRCGITPEGIGALCGCGGFVQTETGAFVHAENCERSS